MTVCVSTQAGCAMACRSAPRAKRVSGADPGRDRRAGWLSLCGRPPRVLSWNIVFMGMGEPLANYDRVWGAVVRLHDDMGLSARHLTLSTVGIVPGIRRLAAEALPVNLAVTLHAANDELLRRASCPSIGATRSRRWRRPAPSTWPPAGGASPFEWAMIDGVNDRESDAVELAGCLHAPWAPTSTSSRSIPRPATPWSVLSRGTGALLEGPPRCAWSQRHHPRHSRCRDQAACGQLVASGPRKGNVKPEADVAVEAVVKPEAVRLLPGARSR